MQDIRSRRVLAVGPVPPPVHGAARVTEQVITELRRRGVPVQLMMTSVARGRTYHFLRLLRHIGSIVLITNPANRTVYVAGAGGLGLWYQLAILWIARRLGRAVYFHHHSYAYLRSYSSAMSRIAAQRPVHIFLSEGMVGAYRATYGEPHDCIVQSNAAFVGAAVAVPQRDRATGELRLIHVSNLSRNKGLDRVLAIYAAMQQTGRACSLTLVGPFASDDDEEVFATWTGPQIIYMGPLPPSEIAEALKLHDVFLFPSQYPDEAEPLVVLEAFSCGLKVLASPVGCLPELLRGPLGQCCESTAEFVEVLTRMAERGILATDRLAIQQAFESLARATPLLDRLQGSILNVDAS